MFVFIFLTFGLIQKLSGQATSATGFNLPTGVDYLGWATTAGTHLDVKTEDDTCIYFYTNAGAGTYLNRKMMIYKRDLNNVEHAGVGIQSTQGTPITRLRSLLHLGNNSVAGVAGWRPWLDVGTFAAKGSDYAYFGTMSEDGDSTEIAGDDNDAVIVWGDNLQDAHDGADNLRIIFNAPMNNINTANQYLGLEISRYSPLGRVGIGNFSNPIPGSGSGIEPQRRLEIYGENNDGFLNAAAPQLRLTHTPNANVNLGIHTDFETTVAGDLFINPSTDAGGNPTNGNVGINVFNPATTLEINSNDNPLTPGTGGMTGNSGVRFSDLTTALTPLTTSPWLINNHCVLTVDANGQVVLVRDDGSNGTVTNGCPGPGNSNFLPKMNPFIPDDLTCSQVYDNATTVGIGTGTGVVTTLGTGFNQMTTLPKLQVRGETYLGDGDIWMNDGGGAIKRVFSMYGVAGLGALAIGHGAGNPGAMGTSSSNGCLFIGFQAAPVIGNVNSSNFIGDGSAFNYVGNGDRGNNFFGVRSGANFNRGNYNLFMGNEVASGIFAQGDLNIMIGSYAGLGFSSGDGNTIVGSWTTVNVPDGDDLVLLGNRASVSLIPVPASVTNAMALGANTSVNCSDCASISNTRQQVGIGYSWPTAIGVTGSPAAQCKLYVTGWPGSPNSAFFNGDIWAGAINYPSDSSLKSNIEPFTGGLDIISQLHPKTYDYNTQSNPGLNLSNENQIGLLAQDLESILPVLVNDMASPPVVDSIGNIIAPTIEYKGINYVGLIPVLIQGMKEQQAQMDSLSGRLDSLVVALANCCNAAPRMENPNSGSIKLTNSESIILDQNVPNPFADKTDISYSIPESVIEARIVFYDQSGKILKTYEINHKGIGTLTVFGEDLSSGIYSYTLVADGKSFETKRMIKQK